MTRSTCASCLHFSPPPPPQRPMPGWLVVGTCATGGPTPEDGCSDVHRDETCERHEPGRGKPKRVKITECLDGAFTVGKVYDVVWWEDDIGHEDSPTVLNDKGIAWGMADSEWEPAP